MLDKVVECLKTHEIHQHASLKYRSFTLLEKRPAVHEIIYEHQEIVEGNVSMDVPSEKVQAVKTQLKEEKVMARLSQKLG